MRYGVPYKGSKNQIAEWVCGHFPKTTNFYDLFAGGCAITHCAMEKNIFRNYHANDIADAHFLFMDAVYGKYQNETRWISREDFKVLYEKEPYIKYAWSFGNNGRDYLYSKEIEPYKRACHYAIVFDDWKELEKLYPKITVDSVKTIFQSIVDMLTKRQTYELLDKNSDFPTVRAKKGVSKNDISRVVKMTMLISIPEFSIIERLANYNEDEKYKASYEYTRILNDSQKHDDGFYSLLMKLQNIIIEKPIYNAENYADYAKRIITQIPQNPIYNDLYKQIIVISILYNNWKDN